MFLRKMSCGALLFLAVLNVSCSKKSAQSIVAHNGIQDTAGGFLTTAQIKTGEKVSAPSTVTFISDAVETQQGAVQKSAQNNARYQQLDAVLSKMSPRFKSVVHIADADKDVFLSDLQAVLLEEETFRPDDLTLYYLIDKKHSVSADYVPKDLVPVKQGEFFNVSRNDLSLRPDVYDALCALGKGALTDGIKLMVSSTYRSYAYQERLFARYVAEDGEALAERYSARAGTSQHQLGVAVDFGSITDDFADTKQGKWLLAHCEEYGWSLSFPKEYEDVTGFMWECWHFRYIGIPACRFQNKWFGDVQQFMIEFLDAWKRYTAV